MLKSSFHALCIILSMLLMPLGASAAQDYRLVLKFKEGLPTRTVALANGQNQQPVDFLKLNQVLGQLSSIHRTPLSSIRQFQNHSVVVKAQGVEDVQQLIQRLQSDPSISSVHIDRRIKVHAQSPLVGVLNSLDLSLRPRFWHHRTIESQPASANTESMWLNFHGTSTTVVAVLDTGVLFNHPALQGHVLPGYDFVSDSFLANDGQSAGFNGDRDADPSDPGDGVTPDALLQDPACLQVSESSWHGTFTAAMIAGNPNPGEGYFPVGWNSVIVPVRVLGRCGGFSTDLADGIRWAAGLEVPGVPTNPNPARVLNLSLGANGACVAGIEGDAVAAARNAGAIVVVAAGNDGGPVDSPADCPGAFGVAATDQEGFKAFYSNFGPFIDITAPGGDSAFPVWSAGNAGLAGPSLNTYRSKIGSSFASPMVAAAAAQVLAFRPNSTVDDLEQDLKSSARPFLNLRGTQCVAGTTLNVECRCTTSTCGAGMLDISRAVFARGVVATANLFSNTGNVLTPGGSKVFSAEGSQTASTSLDNSVTFRIGTVARASGASASPTLSVSGLRATVTAPAGVNGFELIARGASGVESSALVTVAQSQTVAPTLVFALLDPILSGSIVGGTLPIGTTGPIAEPSTGGTTPQAGTSAAGGGGGGSFGLLGLLGLVALFSVFLKPTKA
ncbi:MAG: S8 family peptidase [Limnobacter sp.]|nr:S8 family peptidase [Limnobacter sp.]